MLVNCAIDTHTGLHEKFKGIRRVVYENFGASVNHVLTVEDSEPVEEKLVYFSDARHFSDGLAQNIPVDILLSEL